MFPISHHNIHLLFLMIFISNTVTAQIDTMKINDKNYPIKYSSLDSINNSSIIGYYLFDTTQIAIIRNFSHGKRNGKTICYYPDGNIRLVINYKKGLKHGYLKNYLENGQLNKIGRYKNGKRHGIWIGYLGNSVWDKSKYRKGERIWFVGYCPKFR